MSRKAPRIRNKPRSHTGDLRNYPLEHAIANEARSGSVLTVELAQRINNEIGRHLHGTTKLTDLHNNRNNAWFSAITVLPRVARLSISEVLSEAVKLYITVDDVRKVAVDETSNKVSFLVLALSPDGTALITNNLSNTQKVS